MKKTKKSAFVPRVVFSSVCIGVVPACALAACGGDDSSGGKPDAQLLGVGACCFEAGQGVAVDAFARDVRNDTTFSVADVGFRPDASDAADAHGDGDGSG